MSTPSSSTALAKALRLSGDPVFQSGKAEQAFDRARRLYRDELHWSGVTLIDHTLGVLRTLLPFQPDAETVCACLLQHALKTRRMTLSEIEEEFGAGVRLLVSSVHLLSHVTMRNRRSSIDDLRLMLLSVSDDVRVLLIILCDRCYVLENLRGVPPADRRRICRDVLHLFAPVAARLGIHSLKQRLESLAFPIVHPLDAAWVTEQISAIHARVGTFLDAAARDLTEALRHQSIPAIVHGREKLPYSIFRKMKTKSVTVVENLPDLFALRVLVETEEDCYRALGLLHRLGRPAANRFKDYISFPKPNGYRSLHTTVARLPGIPDGVSAEVQIRTHAMHREAEYGIAAHWSYKEGGTAERMLQRVQLQQVLTSQQPVEMADSTAPRLADHIFALTPKGDIIELPEGATVLDFAFQIHTDLGLSFRSARVNGSVVPLQYELENGDVVEILTRSSPRPSPEWMQLLNMASSRSRLRRYLHSVDREAFVQAGRDKVNAELAERRMPLLTSDLSVLRRYKGNYLPYGEREDLLMKIGQGSDKPATLFRYLDLLRDAPPAPAQRPLRKRRGMSAPGLPVETENGLSMPLRFAKCCNPLEGDREKLTGSITRQGFVMVHKAACRLVKKGNPERRIGVRWK